MICNYINFSGYFTKLKLLSSMQSVLKYYGLIVNLVSALVIYDILGGNIARL